MATTATQAKPGEARAPGPTYQQAILRDSSPPPPAFLEDSYTFDSDADIPYTNYTSREYAQAEFEKLWPRVWQMACREEHIPEPGDFHVYDIGHLSAIVTRTPSGAIKAFVNACMHRGTALKLPDEWSYCESFRCPFHGWTFSLDGELIDLPEGWDFPHVTGDSHRLRELRVGTWGGFVFVNFDPHAESLETFLGVLPEHFRDFHIEDRYVETHVRKRLPVNWKAAEEAFMEAYHVKETHAGGREFSEPITTYDIFPPNVNRFIHTIGAHNPRRPVPLTEQQLLEQMWGRRGPADAACPTLPEGMTARDFYARHVQQQLGQQYDQDFSHYSTAQTLDSIEYFLFPNFFIFPGLSLPMAYRFRPDPQDPDYSYFDLYFLRPKHPENAPPPPPEPLLLDIQDSYTLAEGLGALGAVYDQDTDNMAAQTRGFKTCQKGGQTLGNYQESRIRHVHARVNDYVRG
ncbi:MAG: aromatic ring-hydroxylating dioxygenase subunit alpha [Pseudomonadales bacterium]|nr:aromatic ring-hydroxylating dioxygenase subunit alpha [Pseudomonadales bacterium]MCP5185976.1 aromatic ring-hydroxylating dioxygenase subunit alpha [Pseudomonadales bacterium]